VKDKPKTVKIGKEIIKIGEKDGDLIPAKRDIKPKEIIREMKKEVKKSTIFPNRPQDDETDRLKKTRDYLGQDIKEGRKEIKINEKVKKELDRDYSIKILRLLREAVAEANKVIKKFPDFK